jgi:hypothetical protein
LEKMEMISHPEVCTGFYGQLKSLARRAALGLALFVSASALAQPGEVPPPGLLIKVETSGRLQDGQETDLVYLEGVGISDLQRFESSAGRTHLTFTVDVGGEQFSAIMYGGDWGDAEEARLGSGTVSLLGLWDEYNGAPSLTTKWVEGADENLAETEEAPTDEVQEEHDLVLIEGAMVSDVTKFVSKSLKMHVRFVLQAPGDDRSLSGIAYEGSWNSDMLETLRSGTANLVGYWDEYQGSPSFVLLKLE